MIVAFGLIAIFISIFAIFLAQLWIVHLVQQSARRQRQLSRKEDSILTEIDDLRSAVSDLTAADGALATSIAAAVAELESAGARLLAISTQETISPQDVENAAQFVKTVANHLTAAKAALDAAAAPPAAAPRAATPTDVPPAAPVSTDATDQSAPAASSAP